MIVAAAGLWARPALAHPHVWVEAVTTFLVSKGTITGIRVQWKFDEFFSATLFEDFDKNRNKRFDGKEPAELEKGAFEPTARQHYFTYVKVDGKLMKGLHAKEFAPRAEKGIVYYSFLLPFPEPVDPRRSALTVTYYEDTFYVDVAPAEHDAIRFDGDGSLACKGTVAPDPNTTIYFGQVHPLTVSLQC
jgi:tRNA threonylcarbamoyladenosine biosynthesis protein TsaE